MMTAVTTTELTSDCPARFIHSLNQDGGVSKSPAAAQTPVGGTREGARTDRLPSERRQDRVRRGGGGERLRSRRIGIGLIDSRLSDRPGLGDADVIRKHALLMVPGGSVAGAACFISTVSIVQRTQPKLEENRSPFRPKTTHPADL